MLRNLLVLSVVSAFVLAIGCGDPVHDDAIAALGDEAAGVATGPNHRPGQPCVLCHSKGGPASATPFAVAGTIYATNASGAAGAPNITVQFVDARGGAPLLNPKTNAVGNFWVLASDWPGIAFPLRVGIYNDPASAPVGVMNSLIGREGSCNFCHRAFFTGTSLTPDQVAANQSSEGSIFVKAGGT